MSDEPFYASGRTIHQRPATVVRPDGTRSVTLGFPVCTLSDYVGDDAATHVACLLNAGHAALAALDAPAPATEAGTETRHG